MPNIETDGSVDCDSRFSVEAFCKAMLHQLVSSHFFGEAQTEMSPFQSLSRDIMPIRQVGLANNASAIVNSDLEGFNDISGFDSGGKRGIELQHSIVRVLQPTIEQTISIHTAIPIMLDYRSFLIDAYRLVTMPARVKYARDNRRSGKLPIAVLFYHRISDELINPWTMSDQDFSRQVDWMQENFDMISLEEAQRRINEGFNDKPAISITFDDGYADNCNSALPMLLQRGIPVTYFVTMDPIVNDKPFAHDVDHGQSLRPNNIESICALANAGVEIGSHTRNHLDLGDINDEAILFDEVITATRELEQLINRPVRYFAFPFGQQQHLNQRVFELAREHGFAGVCSTLHAWNHIGQDSFHIRRMHGDPNFSRMKNWLTFDPRSTG